MFVAEAGYHAALFVRKERDAFESVIANATKKLRPVDAPRTLREALQLILFLTPGNMGQETAQREITAALESALEARRQRILLGRSEVNLVKWACLILQAFCALRAIAIVHSGDRVASRIAIGIFATGVAAPVLLILAHDRPFTGALSYTPEPLLQVIPEAGSGA